MSTKATTGKKIGTLLLSGVAGVGGVVATTAIENATTNIVEEYEFNNVHKITSTDTYEINGVEVTSAEFAAFLEDKKGGSSTPTTVTRTITSSDFDIDGIARLSSLIDFDFEGLDTYAAKVLSDKVVKVEYDYAADFEANFPGGTFNSYGLGNLIYQDITQEGGLYFAKGVAPEEGFELTIETTPEVGDYIFYFTETAGFSALEFSDVFDSITLTIEL